MQFFNKKVIKESILENTNTNKSIIKYTSIIDNKRAYIGNIEEYLDDVCAITHDEIKNIKLNEGNIELLNIKKHILKYINDMLDPNKKRVNKNITKDTSANNSTNKKITKDNSAKNSTN